MKWFVKCFRHYADFRGRAPLPEFWYFVLFLLPVLFLGFAVVLGVLNCCNVGDAVRRYAVFLVGLPFLLPYLAVMVRRLHDSGRSGWRAGVYLLVSIAGRVVGCFSLKPGAAAWLADADLATAILQGVYLVFMIYWLCLPGEPGENSYGPVPEAG